MCRELSHSQSNHFLSPYKDFKCSHVFYLDEFSMLHNEKAC